MDVHGSAIGHWMKGFVHVYGLPNLRVQKLKVITICWVLIGREWWEYIYGIVSLVSRIVPRGFGSVSGSPEGFQWISLSGTIWYYWLIIYRWKMFPEMLNYIYNTLKMFYLFYILIKYQQALIGQEEKEELGHKGPSGGGAPALSLWGPNPNRGGSCTPP